MPREEYVRSIGPRRSTAGALARAGPSRSTRRGERRALPAPVAPADRGRRNIGDRADHSRPPLAMRTLRPCAPAIRHRQLSSYPTCSTRPAPTRRAARAMPSAAARARPRRLEIPQDRNPSSRGRSVSVGSTRVECARRARPGASSEVPRDDDGPGENQPAARAHEPLDRAALRLAATSRSRRPPRRAPCRARRRALRDVDVWRHANRAITGHPRSSSAATMNFPSHPRRPSRRSIAGVSNSERRDARVRAAPSP